jgi:phosphosulfolactate synthase (CoM biosynthesis protein A)
MNFDYDIETKKATFDSVEISTGATMADVTSEVKSEVIQNNIDEFLPVLPKFNATSD